MEFKKPLDEAVWRNLKGYCISCGYLGKRSLYYDEVYEANDNDRTYFSFVSNTSPLPQHSGTIPCCFVNALPLSKEFRELEKKYQRAKDNSEISMEITTRDINCSKWVPYQSFRTPKEHFEEFNMQQQENDRREFELKITQMQIEANAQVSKVGIWIGIAAIILAVAEVLTMNENALLWKWIASIVSLIRNVFI